MYSKEFLNRGVFFTGPVLLTALIISSFSMYGCEGDRMVVNLKGNWKFSLGDNKDFALPDYDDKNWESVYAPSSWENEGFRFYNGYAWYRKSFKITEKDLEGALYLYLGTIDDVDEVYLNGHFIGSMGGFPPEYYSAYNAQRNYLLPVEHLLTDEDNVIAVRVYDDEGEGGIVGRNIGIYNYGSYSASTFSLMGNWKFHLSDNKDWAMADYDDSGWESIVVPSSWEDQGFRDYDGFAWYRKTFTLPAGFPVEDMVLLAGVIDDMDEVYLNGRKIGGTGDIDRHWSENNEWNKRRIYTLPRESVKPGKENTIAIRVYDQKQRGGIYEGPVVIVHASEYKEFWKRYNLSRHYFHRNYDYDDGSYTTISVGPFRFEF